MAFMSSLLICDHNSYSVVQRKVWFTVFHCIMLIFFNFLQSSWIRGDVAFCAFRVYTDSEDVTKCFPSVYLLELGLLKDC